MTTVRRTMRRRLSALGVTVAVGLGTAAAAGAVEPGPSPRPLPAAPRLLVEAMRSAEALDEVPGLTPAEVPPSATSLAQAVPTTIDTTGCVRQRVVATSTGSGASRTITLRTAPTAFRINAVPAAWWRTPPVPTAVWQLYFRGLMWVGDVVSEAAATNDRAAIDAMVVTAAASVARNPDPGTSAAGWDEGTNLRREQALNCLWRVSGGDRRLLPAMEATARANMDMSRYYGLPRNQPHNHGLMANLALLDSGDLLDRAQWRDVATARLVRDSAGAFTTGGFSIEQSSAYTIFNRDAWNDAADLLAASSDRTVAARAAGIRRDTARATTALGYLTLPDSTVIAYGDGDPGRLAPHPGVAGVLRDDRAGVVAGRWSWSDPRTTIYTLRYGNKRWAHGHQDRTSLTWATDGVQVLVDPGTYSYDPSAYEAFSRAPDGHNVQLPAGRALSLVNGVALTGATTSGSVHAFSTGDALFGVKHLRNWRIDAAHRSVTLTDTLGVSGTTNLHLDPRWTVVRGSGDRRTLVFDDGAGRLLTVTGTSPIAVRDGLTRPVAGWVFPAYEKRVAAPQLAMSSPPGTSRITLTVSAAPVRPTPGPQPRPTRTPVPSPTATTPSPSATEPTPTASEASPSAPEPSATPSAP